MRKLISFLGRSTGRNHLRIDESMPTADLIALCFRWGTEFLRYQINRPTFGCSGFLGFLGRGTRIIGRSHLFMESGVAIGSSVKINAVSRGGVFLRANVVLKDYCVIDCVGVVRQLGEKLVIGHNTGFSERCFIQVRGPVIIGSHCIFGPEVKIFSEGHNFNDLSVPIMYQGETRKGVLIEDDVWVGAGAIILDGSIIRSGTILAAGSVFSGESQPNSIYAGVPAKFIRSRES